MWGVLALFILSLYASIRVTPVNAPAAFLLTPTRVWELMLGALLVVGFVPRIESQVAREAASAAGIGLIAYAVFRFSPTTPFPGWAALIPCFGAALVIYAGEEGSPTTVSKILSLRPLVFLGLISYSLYLWHWPLLVFGRYWNITPLTNSQTAVLLLASFVCAVLSWAYVEQPFRRKQAPISKRIVFAAAAMAMSAAAVFGAITGLSGWPSRFSPQVLAISEIRNAEPDMFIIRACKGRPANNPCILGAPAVPTVAIWGDSHALAMLPTFAELAERNGISVKAFVKTGCLVLLGSYLKNAASRCASHNARTIKILESSQDIRTVILMSYYAYYVDRPDHGGPIRNDADASPVVPASQFEADLRLAVDRLLAAGKTVVLVYPVPNLEFSVPEAVGRVLVRGGDPTLLNLAIASFNRRERLVFDALDKAGQDSERIIRVYPHKRLCDAKQCLVYKDGQVLYGDDNHLSHAGAEIIIPDFEPIFSSGAKARATTVLSTP